jgi:SAM-dependent methyltransferase
VNAQAPRRARFVLKNFRLDQKAVLDVVCGPGEYLRHFGPGSVGLDLHPRGARAAGLDAREWNFEHPLPQELWGQFDAVWSSNTYEHVPNPHVFLINLRKALVPGGQIFVAVPTTTRLTRGPWRGFLAADHINFFTPLTLGYSVERAGFDVTFLGTPSIPSLPLRIARRLAGVSPVTLCVASLVEDFQYPDKAHKSLVDGAIAWKS